jgi:hypothetical protein
MAGLEEAFTDQESGRRQAWAQDEREDAQVKWNQTHLQQLCVNDLLEALARLVSLAHEKQDVENPEPCTQGKADNYRSQRSENQFRHGISSRAGGLQFVETGLSYNALAWRVGLVYLQKEICPMRLTMNHETSK